jgi:hypothetical protein
MKARRNSEQKWTQAEIALLGTMPDPIRTKRLELNIATRVHRGWTADEEALLGTIPDAELAKRIGLW